jgi:hypothetical protein
VNWHPVPGVRTSAMAWPNWSIAWYRYPSARAPSAAGQPPLRPAAVVKVVVGEHLRLSHGG